jgi:hypothetical protein
MIYCCTLGVAILRSRDQVIKIKMAITALQSGSSLKPDYEHKGETSSGCVRLAIELIESSVQRQMAWWTSLFLENLRQYSPV